MAAQTLSCNTQSEEGQRLLEQQYGLPGNRRFHQLLGPRSLDAVGDAIGHISTNRDWLLNVIIYRHDVDQQKLVAHMRVSAELLLKAVDDLQTLTRRSRATRVLPWTPHTQRFCLKHIRQSAATLTALRTLALVAGLQLFPNELLFVVFWFL